MADTHLETDGPTLKQLHAALDNEHDIRALLRDLHPAAVAHLLESLPLDRRDTVWEQLDADEFAEVLAEAEDGVRLEKLREMQPREVAAVAKDLDPDDAVDLLQDLPEALVAQVLAQMDEQNREILSRVLQYPEDTAGGLMNVDAVSVRPDVTLEVVQRYLRARGHIPERTNRLMVVDREGHYLGMLRIADLLTASPERLVGEIMDTETGAIAADTPEDQVAQIFEQLNLVSAAVVDDDGVLIGRITIDDVVDVIREQGEASGPRRRHVRAHCVCCAPPVSVAGCQSGNGAARQLGHWLV